MGHFSNWRTCRFCGKKFNGSSSCMYHELNEHEADFLREGIINLGGRIERLKDDIKRTEELIEQDKLRLAELGGKGG